MELKLKPGDHNKKAVLTFNQTRMELKLINSFCKAFQFPAFNQTRMELKQALKVSPGVKSSAFNQTRMELKPVPGRAWAPVSTLLIRPEWN